jgi:hypothetical protein
MTQSYVCILIIWQTKRVAIWECERTAARPCDVVKQSEWIAMDQQELVLKLNME